jgi:ABC-type nitrate/sulfonate/bicarbonate transport system ATPase subunit
MVVRFERVSKVYVTRSRARTVALEHVSLDLEKGQLIVLLGPSGCGKTTLLKLLAGFEHPTSGRVLVNNEMVRQPGPDRGTIFQSPTLFPWLTALDNVRYGPRVRGLAGKAVTERAKAALDSVGLADFHDYLPHNLSGGMQQRVAIARVLINDPQIVLADEPFAALDEYTRRAMQDLFLRTVADRSRTLLFVTHSIEEAVFLADRIFIMTPRPGRIYQHLDVTMPRPRERSRREFLDLMGRVFEIVSQDFAVADVN